MSAIIRHKVEHINQILINCMGCQVMIQKDTNTKSANNFKKRGGKLIDPIKVRTISNKSFSGRSHSMSRESNGVQKML